MTYLIAYMGGCIALAILCLVAAQIDNKQWAPGYNNLTLSVIIIVFWPLLILLPYMVKK